MATEFRAYDAANYLDTQADVAAFLNAALELEDPEVFKEALGAIARARGMSAISKEAGVSRENLYRSLSEEGNPRFTTLSKVLDALGMRLCVVPKSIA